MTGPVHKSGPFHDFGVQMLIAMLAEVTMHDPSDPHVELPKGMTEEQAYAVRNAFVYQALAQAAAVDFPYGIQPDPNDPAWVIAFIELPTGQVSWHLPCYVGEWDGHTTAEKYHRVRAFEQGEGQ